MRPGNKIEKEVLRLNDKELAAPTEASPRSHQSSFLLNIKRNEEIKTQKITYKTSSKQNISPKCVSKTPSTEYPYINACYTNRAHTWRKGLNSIHTQGRRIWRRERWDRSGKGGKCQRNVHRCQIVIFYSFKCNLRRIKQQRSVMADAERFQIRTQAEYSVKKDSLMQNENKKL